MKESKNIQSGASQSVLNENFEPMHSKTIKCLNIDRRPGTTFYQTLYSDPEKEHLKRTCAGLMQENDILKSELEKFKKKPQLHGNEDYHVSYENNPSGFQIVKITTGHHQKVLFKYYGGFFRKSFGKKMSSQKKYAVVEYSVRELKPELSTEEIRSAYNRTGDAVDTVTSTVRYIKELVELFQFAWQDATPIADSAVFNACSELIGKIADSCGCEDGSYTKIFPEFTGDISLDARIFRDIYNSYDHKLERFQAVLFFFVEIFSDFTFLLDQEFEPLFSFVEYLKTNADNSNIAAQSTTFVRMIMDKATGISALAKEASPTVTAEQAEVLEFCIGLSDGVSAKALREHLKMTSKSKFHKGVLSPLTSAGFLEMTCVNTSSKQKYRLTEAGLTVLRKIRPGKTFFGVSRTEPETVSGVSTPETN